MNISVVAVLIALLLGFGLAVWLILRWLNK